MITTVIDRPQMVMPPLKSIASILNTGFLNVWEGAVRSGKTVTFLQAWINFIYESPDTEFIMSGRSLGALIRNCIEGEMGILAMLGDRATFSTNNRGGALLSITMDDGSIKKCRCFGAINARSYEFLRGMTAGGWLADEVNMHDPKFVREAFNRTIKSKFRKHFWTLNPDNPNHWLYREYLDRYETMTAEQKMAAGGYWYWHYTLEDNPVLDQQQKDQLKLQYVGMYYDRYILGLRVAAENLIYTMFDKVKNTYQTKDLPSLFREKYSRYISIDYGTTNPCVFLEIFDDGKISYIEREYYWDSSLEQNRKTDLQYFNDLLAFCGKKKCPIVVDPSAASFIALLRQNGFYVLPADNDVNPGIMAMMNLLDKAELKVNAANCPNFMKEIAGYSWDMKVKDGKEIPVKSGDHVMDSSRYYISTVLPKYRRYVIK